MPPPSDTTSSVASKNSGMPYARNSAPEAARWGSLHHLHLRHPFSEQSGLLKGWDMDRREYPGTGASVSPGDFDWNADEWNVGFMASMRIVIASRRTNGESSMPTNFTARLPMPAFYSH